MFERVKAVIERQLNLKGQEITPETELLTDLGINSLELVELVCTFEMEFDLVVPEKDLRKFAKVKDIIEYLEKVQ